MLLFSVTGGKQKDFLLFDFQENNSLCKKMFIPSVGRYGKIKEVNYAKLAHLDFVDKKIIDLILKLNVSF